MPKRDPDFYSSDDLENEIDPGALPDDDDAAAFLKAQEAKGEKGSAAKRSNQAKSKISGVAAPSVNRDLSVSQIRESLNERIREAFKKYNLEGLASSPDYLKSRANVKSFLEKYAEKMPAGPVKEKFLAEAKNIEDALGVLKSNPTMMQLDQSSAAIQKYTEELAKAASEHAAASTTAPEVSGVSTNPVKSGKTPQPVDPLSEAVKRQGKVKAYAKGANLTHESLDDPATLAELEKLGLNAQEVRMALGPKPAPVQTGMSDEDKRKLAAAQTLEEVPTKESAPTKPVEEVKPGRLDSVKKGLRGISKNPLLQMLWPSESFKEIGEGVALQGKDAAIKASKKNALAAGEAAYNKLAPVAGVAADLPSEVGSVSALRGRLSKAIASKDYKALNAVKQELQGLVGFAPKTSPQMMSLLTEANEALPGALTKTAMRTASGAGTAKLISGIAGAGASIPGYMLLSLLASKGVNTLAEYTGLPITPENRMLQAQEELRPSLDDMMIQAEIQARQQDRAAEAIRNDPQLAAQLQSQARIEQAQQQGRAAHTYTIGGDTGFNSSATDLLSLVQGG